MLNLDLPRILTPGCECTQDIVQGAEPVCIEALIAQPSAQALDVAVLHGAARLDMHQINLVFFRPAQAAGEIRTPVRCPGASFPVDAPRSVAPARASSQG